MSILGNTIAALKRPKVLACLRSDYPFLPVVAGLIPGQFAAFCLHIRAPAVSTFLLCALCAALALRFSRKSALVLLAAFFLGLMSQELALPPPGETGLESFRSYQGVVNEEPRRRRSGEVEVSLLTGVGQKGLKILCRGPELPWRNLKEARRGDVFAFTAVFKDIRPDLNPFSYEATLYRRGYTQTCRLKHVSRPFKRSNTYSAVLRDYISATVVRVLGEEQKGGMFLSMAFGARDVLSRETDKAFKETGLAHLLVFSGYQVMLVYHSVLLLLRLFLRLSIKPLGSLWLRLSVFLSLSQLFSWIALPFSLLLVWLCGVEGSSLRAAVAVVIYAASRLLERGGGMLNSILVSLGILCLIWPGCWCEPGIELTFAALLGICCAAAGEKKGYRLINYLRVCFHASLFTSVIVLPWFGTFSPGGFLLNPLAAPLVSLVACNGGYLAVLLILFGLDPSGWLLQICGCLLEKFMMLVRHLSDFSWVSFKLDGFWRWILMSGLLWFVLRVCAGRFRDYLGRRGL